MGVQAEPVRGSPQRLGRARHRARRAGARANAACAAAPPRMERACSAPSPSPEDQGKLRRLETRRRQRNARGRERPQVAVASAAKEANARANVSTCGTNRGDPDVETRVGPHMHRQRSCGTLPRHEPKPRARRINLTSTRFEGESISIPIEAKPGSHPEIARDSLGAAGDRLGGRAGGRG
eukprot:6174403-Pleurochrysis_carterae.AAC.3